ncbi:hypothetical protein [Streptomyces sp. NPDC047079]
MVVRRPALEWDSPVQRAMGEIAPGSRTVVADHPALLSEPACRR